MIIIKNTFWLEFCAVWMCTANVRPISIFQWILFFSSRSLSFDFSWYNFSSMCSMIPVKNQMLENCTSSFTHLIYMSECISAKFVSLYRKQSNMQHSISHLLKLWCINLCTHNGNIASIKWAQSSKQVFTEHWTFERWKNQTTTPHTYIEHFERVTTHSQMLMPLWHFKRIDKYDSRMNSYANDLKTALKLISICDWLAFTVASLSPQFR